jgi:hypothetical protein
MIERKTKLTTTPNTTSGSHWRGERTVVSALAVQQVSKFVGRLVLHRRQHVPVDLQRNHDVLVAEPLLHEVRLCALREQQRRAGVPQAVHGDALHIGGLAQSIQAFVDACDPERRSERVKDVLLPSLARED